MDVTGVTHIRKPMYKSLCRLAVIIKLILRCFTPKLMLVQQQESRAVNSNVKTIPAMSSKRKLSERIHQRLLQRLPSTEDDNSAIIQSSTVISCEAQNVLVTPPWNRSSELLEKALKELQTCSDVIKDFPNGVQKSICKLGWYQLLEGNRVIHTAGCTPTSYYIVLSGSVIEVDGDVRSSTGNTVNVYTNGTSFGDKAIIDGTQRTTSCYAKGQVELLVISRSDYVDLSLRQTRISYQESKHFMFCRMVSILKQWPLDQLCADNCTQYYYKPGSVIVRDSKKCDHIFIVMSGSCNVVKRFVDNSNSVTSKAHQKSLTSDAAKSPLSTQVHSQNRRVGDEGEIADNDEQSFRKMRDRRATYPNFQEDTELDKPKGKQILIQLQTLHPKDIFGLSTILYEDEPSISLVSNNSECILIAKSFILAHMTERIKAWLYKQVQQYPSQEMMMKRIKEHHHWNIYKQTLVSHLKKKHT